LVLALLASSASTGCRTTEAFGGHRSAEAALAHAQHLARLDTLLARMDTVLARTAPSLPTLDSVGVRRAFADARAVYKRAEAVLELETPGAADALNGPALPEIDEAEGETQSRPPEGFQALEALLWPDLSADRAAIVLEASRIKAHVLRARQVTAATRFDDSAVWDAARQELARITTLALAGFDSPVARRELPEMVQAVEGVRASLRPWRTAGGAAFARADSALAATMAALDTTVPSDATDRLRWLTSHALPAARLLPAAREAAGVPLPPDPRPWRAASATPYDADAFDPTVYARTVVDGTSDARVALGRDLFNDASLSGTGGMACASCHVPSLAFTDGKVRSTPLAGSRAVLRNAPTLVNSGLQAAQFADARAASLEDQVFDVVHNADEMRGSLDASAARYAADPDARARFAAAFQGTADTTPSPAAIRRAIAAFVRSLTALNAPFDRYVRGDASALTPDAQRGANLYLGKAKCGTCHFLPLTNGTVPPLYAKAELEIIGVPATATWRGARVDADQGKGARTHFDLQRFSFKTPTVRNSALTAPYMHNGVYRTLGEVVRFYNVGGGAGLGIALEHQTLPPDRLELSAAEQRDLIAFLEALTDTVTVRHTRTPLPSGRH
jgi:cytochrome c peroxidase